jgi:cation transport regulator ChaC
LRPGRVVTLVESAESECWGVAYQVEPGQREAVLEQLDYREKGGYRLVDLPFRSGSGQRGPRTVSVYIGGADNPHYVGPEDEETTAAIIREASGPSGHNAEYLLRLAEALEALQVMDPHVLRLHNLVVDPHSVLVDSPGRPI